MEGEEDLEGQGPPPEGEEQPPEGDGVAPPDENADTVEHDVETPPEPELETMLRALGTEREIRFGFSVSEEETKELLKHPTAAKLWHNLRNRFNKELGHVKDIAKRVLDKEAALTQREQRVAQDHVAVTRKIAEPVDLGDLGEEPDQMLDPKAWQLWHIKKEAREVQAATDAERKQRVEDAVELQKHEERLAENTAFLREHPELRKWLKENPEDKKFLMDTVVATGRPLKDVLARARIDPNNPTGEAPKRSGLASRPAARALDTSQRRSPVLPPVPEDVEAIEAYIEKYGEEGQKKVDRWAADRASRM